MSIVTAVCLMLMMLSFECRLCDGIDISNDKDIANLFSNLAGNFENVVQYNRDNRAFEVFSFVLSDF